MWILILRGFNEHLNQNKHFLEKIVPEKVVITLDVPVNPNFEDMISQFSGKVKDVIGSSLHTVMRCNFSTSGMAETLSSDIAIFDTFKDKID